MQLRFCAAGSSREAAKVLWQQQKESRRGRCKSRGAAKGFNWAWCEAAIAAS